MHRDLPLRSEINVTPLVDVCLVLLIIFMVVTPMLFDGVQVALPETRAPEILPETRTQLDVAIGADGTVYLEEVSIPSEILAATLRAAFATAPDTQVVVTADRALPYVRVRDVMRELGLAGWKGAGIETRKRVAEDEEPLASIED